MEGEFKPELLQGVMAVDVLRTLHVVNGEKPCGDMCHTDGGFRLVAFLPAGARAAHRVAAAFGEKLLLCEAKQSCSFWIVLNFWHGKKQKAARMARPFERIS